MESNWLKVLSTVELHLQGGVLYKFQVDRRIEMGVLPNLCVMVVVEAFLRGEILIFI